MESAALPRRPSVVFCNFGDAAKITPSIWQSWVHILARVPGSALWLVRHGGGEDEDEDEDEAAEGAAVVENLRAEMAGRGVSPERLLVTGRLPLSLHLLAKSHGECTTKILFTTSPLPLH